MSQDLILKNLNLQQQKACQILSGPILILAGAGTGKTRTITCRVAYLISQGIRPENILAVTFTNKAADEMKSRIKNLIFSRKLVASSWQLITIGTFHSICVRILRHEVKHLGFSPNFIIYDEDDQIKVVKKIMEDLELDPKKFAPAMILAMISSAKAEFIDFKAYQENYANDFLTKIVAKIYEPYQKFLFKNKAMDFDDLIFNTVFLFKKYPNVLKKYQEKFKYILVDEYQDANHLEYLFINLLAQKHRNLCVCGDDFQAIYGWRNADIQNILNFEKDYKETKIIKLEQNYRSTQNILDTADFVIKQNDSQKEKILWTKRGEGCKTILLETQNERAEGEFVVLEIQKLRESNQKLQYSDFAVLYRTHAQSRALEEIFLQYATPYKIIGGVKFYQRKEIKDIIAYLRLILNPRDEIAFSRIINFPPRGIGEKTAKNLVDFARKNNLDFFSAIFEFVKKEKISPKAKNAFLEFEKMFEKFKKEAKEAELSDLINFVCLKSGYKEYLYDGSEEGEMRWENIKELLTVAGKYDNEKFQINSKSQILNPKNVSQSVLEVFLEEIALFSEVDEWDEKKDAVTLMTLHAAKGLEFDTVFFVGLEENLLPHSKSLFEPAELEEERRLCYVGMTRAKNYLYLIYARGRQIFGQNTFNQVSRFIADLPEKLAKRVSK
ncbi:MAG: UvrD-helicase domain-containing protein [Patescibacteria group bacterium]